MGMYVGLDVVSLVFKPEAILAQLCPPDPSKQVSSSLFGVSHVMCAHPGSSRLGEPGVTLLDIRYGSLWEDW